MKKTLKDKLIQEALDFYKIDSLIDDEDFDFGESDFEDDDFEDDDDDFEFDESEFDDEDDDFEFDDEESEFDDEEEEEENPDKAGLIRSVKGAYLVFKRVTPNNNYEELWIYNIGNVKSQTRIRNSILAGTDVDPVTLRSLDGEQVAQAWSKGNIQYLHIDGIPN